MTRLAFTAPGHGATVEELIGAASRERMSIPLALRVVHAALESRPGTKLDDLLPMRTNLALLAEGWTAEDLPRIEKLEVMG